MADWGRGFTLSANPAVPSVRSRRVTAAAAIQIGNLCYFAMDATRPHELSDGRLGPRFYVVCESGRSFRAISAGHGGGRNSDRKSLLFCHGRYASPRIKRWQTGAAVLRCLRIRPFLPCDLGGSRRRPQFRSEISAILPWTLRVPTN